MADFTRWLPVGAILTGMLPEIDALLDRPLLLLVLLGVGAVIGVAVERYTAAIDREKRKAWWRGRNSARSNAAPLRAKAPSGASVDIASEQLRLVMKSDFTAQRLLNKSERYLLTKIDQFLAEDHAGWRSMAQVSLGEIVQSQDKDAYLAINSKRVDLLIVDSDCQPIGAIEYQGTGHHLGRETAARDAIKKEALRRAGIGYIEVTRGDTPAELRAKLRRLALRVAE